MVEIFKVDFLAESLAFRGGTALHKLYLQPQPRYSEDIDLVQIRSEPIKETIQKLQKTLSFLGKSNVAVKKDNNTIYFRFESEFPTYKLEELLGTKLRALYQRRKGRDLFDLWKAMTNSNSNPELIIKCYKEYMKFSLSKPIPTKKEFLKQLEAKKADSEFLGDTIALLRPDEKYNHQDAFDLITKLLIEIM